MRIPATTALPDIQQSFRDVHAVLDAFAGSKNIDLKGRRIINAGSPQGDQDYVTKADLTALGGGTSGGGSAAVTVGLHSQRTGTPPAPEGAMFFERDRHHLYVAAGGKWTVVDGVHQQFFALIPVDLTADDVRFKFYVSDFNHMLLWTGAQWVFAPGEAGSGFIQDFLKAPDPTYLGWHLCDGATVNWLHVDLSLATGVEVLSIVLPNEQASGTYHEAGVPDLAVYPAVGPAATDTPFNAAIGATAVAQHNSQIIDNTGRPPKVLVYRYFRQ